MLTRWLAVVGMVFLVVMVFWFGLPDAKKSLVEGSDAPAYNLPDLEGEMYGLPEGEVVLLNFWATWCPPCRKEMPSMTMLHGEYVEKGLKIVAISVDRNPDDLSAFVREYSLPFQVLHDIKSVSAKDYGVYRYPESFLVDRQGKIRHHFLGEVDWMSEPIIKKVEAMLNEPKAAIPEEKQVGEEQAG